MSTPVSFAEFGNPDVQVYCRYLDKFVNHVGVCDVYGPSCGVRLAGARLAEHVGVAGVVAGRRVGLLPGVDAGGFGEGTAEVVQGQRVGGDVAACGAGGGGAATSDVGPGVYRDSVGGCSGCLASQLDGSRGAVDGGDVADTDGAREDVGGGVDAESTVAGDTVGDCGVAAGGSAGGDGESRGRHYRRNRAKRLRKRLSGAGRKESGVLAWRVNAAPLSGVGSEAVPEKKGFFAECDDATRKRLRESRAQLLIAENERKRALEEKKLAGMNSPEGFLRDLKRVLAVVGSFKKASDTPVGKWACTVAEGYAETIARSVPSSCPSLESLPFGVVSETTAVDSEKLAAEQAYVRERAELEAAYEESDFLLPDQFEREMDLLRARHPLVFPPTEADLEEKKLAAVMLKLGKFNLNDLTNEEIAKYLD